jgi:hypothetical protein
LLNEFRQLLKLEFQSELPEWFEGIILSFNDFDSNSTNFRYGGFCPGEAWADVDHMKKIIGWLKHFKKSEYIKEGFNLTIYSDRCSADPLRTCR